MEKIKDYLKDKKYGFYVTLGAALFSLLTAIIYAASYAGNVSWWVFVLLLAGAFLGVGVIALKKFDLAPVVIAVASFLAFLLFAYANYWNVGNAFAEVLQFGGSKISLSAGFWVSIIFLLITIIASTASIFFKQKENV